MSVLKYHIYKKPILMQISFSLFLNSIFIDRHWITALITLITENWLQISKFPSQFKFGKKINHCFP